MPRKKSAIPPFSKANLVGRLTLDHCSKIDPSSLGGYTVHCVRTLLPQIGLRGIQHVRIGESPALT